MNILDRPRLDRIIENLEKIQVMLPKVTGCDIDPRSGVLDTKQSYLRTIEEETINILRHLDYYLFFEKKL